jgi:integrase/recombinase XerC
MNLKAWELRELNILDWGEVRDNFKEADLLLGNGFSINLSEKFRYKSIFGSFIKRIAEKEGRYYKVYFYHHGKKMKRSTRTTSRKIAEDIRKKIENEIAIGAFKLNEYSPHQYKRLKEFMDEALEYSKMNKSPRTVEREDLIFNNFSNYVSEKYVNNIDLKIIEGYKAHLRENKEFSASGINIELRHLSAAFTLAVKYGYISENPFKNVKNVKTPKKEPKFLTKKQAAQLLKHTKSRSIYQYIMIALNTGGRISEICQLSWKDVDFENRLIRFKGKGDKERIVPITQVLYKYFKSCSNSNGFVVKGSRDRKEVTHQFRKYADDIGLNDFTFHNLRDTYASWLIQNGVNLKIIQELLGHESIQTTLTYAHLAPTDKFKAVKVIDKLLS